MKPGADWISLVQYGSNVRTKYLGKWYGWVMGFQTRVFYERTSFHSFGRSYFKPNQTRTGDQVPVYFFFGIVAILLLAIVSINYVNLAYCWSYWARNKEVGLRKVMGAGKMQLFRAVFVSESMLLSFARFLLSNSTPLPDRHSFEEFGGVPLNFWAFIFPAEWLGCWD